ncbi:MAG: potassium channel family protein, partial [Pseudomonadota bacterium]|nr:potassium channel family protein [Pseudomonadota bacterium]
MTDPHTRLLRVNNLTGRERGTSQGGRGQMAKRGVSRFDLRDPYYLAIGMRARWFAVTALSLYLAINALFAILYSLVPGCIANTHHDTFSDLFFFSVETLATVGYGNMAPATLYGHVISSIEVVVGMAFTAIITGLIFVRFSKPKSKIRFADHAVVTSYNGTPTLMLR